MCAKLNKLFIPAPLLKWAVISIKNAWWMFMSVFRVLFAPWRITYDPIAELLRADDSTHASATTIPSTMSMADSLTSSWTEMKLQELSYVGITVRTPTSDWIKYHS